MKTLYRILLLTFGCLCVPSAEIKAQLAFGAEFSPATLVANATGGRNPLFVADFNGDGVPDVASIQVNGTAGIRIMFISESGAQLGILFIPLANISDGYSSLLAVDYDEDRDLDIIAVVNSTNASSFVYIENPGLGAFAVANVTTLGTPTVGSLSGLVSIDQNLDGFVDIMGISSHNPTSTTRINLFRNNTVGGFTYVGGAGVIVAVPNPTILSIRYFGMKKYILNNSAVPGLVINGYQDQLFFVRNLATFPTVTFSTVYTGNIVSVLAVNIRDIEVGDLDLDNNTDIVLYEEVVAGAGTHGIKLLQGDGLSGFSPPITLTTRPLSNSTRSFTVGDIDNDNDIDIKVFIS